MDKIAARAVLTAAGLRVAPGAVVSARAVRADAGAAAAAAAALGRPLFVKAPCQGSSFGVFRVDSDDPRALRQALDRAFEFGPRALLERAVDGVEITVPVLGNAADGSARALPAVEIRPGSSRFFDTNEKYSEAGAEELCPPISLTAAVLGAAADAALAAHEALGCAGVSRTDMIASPEGLHVLEVNTLPGLTPRSLLPRSAAVAGIPFPELVSRLIDFALVKERP
jgi:D-alanine-D-alanine ligase